MRQAYSFDGFSAWRPTYVVTVLTEDEGGDWGVREQTTPLSIAGLLAPSDQPDHFGASVALHGNLLAIGQVRGPARTYLGCRHAY